MHGYLCLKQDQCMRYSLLIFTVLLTSCASRKPVDTSGNSPLIIFAGYKIFKGEEIPAAELRWYKLMEGIIKDDRQQQDGTKEFRVELKTKKEEVIDTRYFDDILKRNVEYVNDDGQFERKMITLDSADLIVRIPSKGLPEKIILSVKQKDGGYSTLHEFNIPQKSGK